MHNFDLQWPKTCINYWTTSKDNILVLPRRPKKSQAQITISKIVPNIKPQERHTCKLLKTQKYAQKISVSWKWLVLFSEKDFCFKFCIHPIHPIFLVPVEECINLLMRTLWNYDTNLKLASIMPFWVYHCKINLYDKIRHQISIKMVKLSKKYFWVTQVV